MDKKTREKRIQEFIDWRKDKTEEEIGLAKYLNPEHFPDSVFKESKKGIVDNRKIVDFRTYQPPKEVLEEYKDLLDELHKWARQSRGEE